MGDYCKGIAFIFEGQTEKVFYKSILEYFCSVHIGYTFQQIFDPISLEVCYLLKKDEKTKLIKMNTVGTITQITNSGIWFNSFCIQRHTDIAWSVFLCYDTDSYNLDITKYHEGDWKDLRKSLKNADEIVDLAANADIEDIMLCDFNGVCTFLGSSTEPQMPTGRKGKAKMKKLFRQFGQFYHEGDRAKPLIDSLNKEIIISTSSIPFNKIEELCFD